MYTLKTKTKIKLSRLDRLLVHKSLILNPKDSENILNTAAEMPILNSKQSVLAWEYISSQESFAQRFHCAENDVDKFASNKLILF